MTLLASGQALLIAGVSSLGLTARCELYQPELGGVVQASPLAEPRYDMAAVALADGRVLVAGGRHSGSVASVELYDPETDGWAPAAPLATAGGDRATVLLPGGTVLLVDPWNAERYDSVQDVWTLTGPRALPGNEAVLSLLATGEVLAVSAGGAEVYDPATDIWQATDPMSIPRSETTLTPLRSGEVLAAGGRDASAPPGNPAAGTLTSVEIFDPITRTWRDTERLQRPRRRHAAVAMVSGEVLVAGGDDGETPHVSAELFDPSVETWRLTEDALATRRTLLTAMLLNTGQVLVVGGSESLVADDSLPIASTELYDPLTNLWRPGPELAVAREHHASVLLGTGEALVIGGRDADQRAPELRRTRFASRVAAAAAAADDRQQHRDSLRPTADGDGLGPRWRP